jgi:hypothetical protein
MSFLNVPAISLATAATNAGVSIWLGPDNITRLSIHGEHGAVTGTLKVETSNDPRARPDHPDYASSLWQDSTTDFGLTTPAGGAADFNVPFDNVNFEFLRISYTHAAGTGTLYIWVSGRSS